jgi:hypothetical protein
MCRANGHARRAYLTHDLHHPQVTLCSYYPNPSLLHMYNRDMTVLYYRSNSPRAFFRAGIHPATLEKHLTKGTYYLGKYKFRREFVPLAKYKKTKPSFVELQLMLKKDRGGKFGR